MDLYNLNSARSQGSALTRDNTEYNENLRTARQGVDEFYKTRDLNLRNQKTKDQSQQSQDKLIHEGLDTVAAIGTAGRLPQISATAKAYKDFKTTDQALGNDAWFADSRNFLKSQRNLARSQDGGTYLSQASDYVFGHNNTNPDAPETARQGGGAPGTRPDADTTAPAPAEEPVAERRGPPVQLDEADRPTFRRQDRAPYPAANPNRPGEVLPADTTPARVTGGTGNTPAVAEENTGPALSEARESLQTTTDKLSGKALSALDKAGEYAKTGGKVLGLASDVEGVVNSYSLFKNGLAKNPDGSLDGWKDASQVAGVVGTGLDILGSFIPVLEPIGQAVNAVGAIADTIDNARKDSKTVTNDTSAVSNAPQAKADDLKALGQEKTATALNTMNSAGLIGSAGQHVAQITQSSGTF